MIDATEESGAHRLWDGFVPDLIRPLSTGEWDLFSGKRILITGAGGYLGSAIVRALAKLPVAHLALIDQNEYGLYCLEQEMRSLSKEVSSSFIVGSVLNRRMLQQIILAHSPNLVFHVAALKHVPLMEANPFAAIETNSFGSLALLEETAEAATQARVVLVSTDKAVAPASVMGASKRVAEQILLRARKLKKQDAVSLRMCNVLGSSGSVAPWFAQQIAQGKPVPVTDADATRYFMTAADAVRSILRAAILPCNTGLLVPRINERRLVRDLAEYMLARQSPASPSQVLQTGLRPGEKLHEELFSAQEIVIEGVDPQMLEVESFFEEAALTVALEKMHEAVRTRNAPALWSAIGLVIPSFVPAPDRTGLAASEVHA